MTKSEIGLLSLPLIAALIVSAFAWVAALLAVRRSRQMQARTTIPSDAGDADLDRALNNLSLAISRRNRAARRQPG
jgi:hypothetical protein